MIKVCNVTKRYNKNDIIKSMNFEVKENEIVGFLGPNGAGKTTTMNMITGYSKLDICRNILHYIPILL